MRTAVSPSTAAGIWVDQAHAVATIEPARQPLGHVNIGGEVAALGDDHAPALAGAVFLHVHGRSQGLEQIERGGVIDDYFTGPGANQFAETVAQAPGQVEPAGRIPAADQVLAPFARHHIVHAGEDGNRARAQWSAVEVDHALGQGELAAQGGKGVAGVARQAILSVHSCTLKIL
jgi:hypothetical protein